MKRKLTLVLAVIALLLGTTYYQMQQEEDLSVGAVLPVAGTTYTLAGSGVSSSATSFTLTSFTIPQSGALINDSQISDTFYMTIEPGNKNRQEIVGCTTVTQNGDGTATISGCSRGLSPMTPFTASTSLQFAHSGGSAVIISNPPQLYEQVGFLDNAENITGAWTTSVTPTASGGLATKGYVDGVVNGGALTLDGIAIGATAGDTFATGTIVYYDASQQRWEKADASATTTSSNKLLGIAQGAGTDGSAISGGVLTRGYDETQNGMTAGNTIYLSDTAGATSTSAGTVSVILGQANAAGVLYFDPVQLQYANLANNNVFTGANTFTAATTTFDESITGHASTTYTVYTADGTWTKPAEFEYIVVALCAGGGGGGGQTDATEGSGGGGGGGCSKELLTRNDLSATTSVQILVGAAGAAGAADAAGSAGGSSKFGTFLSATGGSGGATGGAESTGGAGGAGTGGDLNIDGSNGGPGAGIAGLGLGGAGGSSMLGNGGAMCLQETGGASGNIGDGYGAGGGGACSDDSAADFTGAAGIQGVVIITTYF